MYYADIRQAEGKAKPSFTSEHLEKGIANDDEETFKHIASTLYGGGADTVGVLPYIDVLLIHTLHLPDRIFIRNILPSDDSVSQCPTERSRGDR